MSDLAYYVDGLKNLYDLHSLPDRYSEILYHTTSILNEVRQGSEGGHYSLKYITEKCNEIIHLSKELDMDG